MTILVGTPRVPVPSGVPALGHQSHLCLAVGKPIEVQKTPHPSQEEVDRLHQHYMKELENLFEAHKLKYNVPETNTWSSTERLPREGAASKGRAGIREDGGRCCDPRRLPGDVC